MDASGASVVADGWGAWEYEDCNWPMEDELSEEGAKEVD